LRELEIVKLKVENLREILKFLLLLTISILTGEVVLFYQILTMKVPAFLVVFNGIGIVILFFVYNVSKYVWDKMDKYVEELENE
jgi:hypothetical protein